MGAFACAIRRRVAWPAALGLVGTVCGVMRVDQVGAADAPTKPTVTIVLEGTDLLAAQSVAFRVWVENPMDVKLSQLDLRFSGPDFIKIGTIQEIKGGATPEKKCVPTADQNAPIALGALAPVSALDPPKKLCLVAISEVEERDVTIALSVLYVSEAKPGQPKTGPGAAADEKKSGVVVVEKKISVGLFGTETVAGVSLRLAAFFMPGVLFMLIVRLGSVPLLKDLGAPDQAVLSVLISVAVSLLTTLLLEGRVAPIGTGAGVSARFFLIDCAIASAAGVLAVVMRVGRDSIAKGRTRDRDALLVGPEDNDATVLMKALKTHTGDFKPVTVVAIDQTRYIGSLAAATRDGGVALLGWFEIAGAGHPQHARLKNLLDAGEYQAALELAQKESVAVNPRNAIRTIQPMSNELRTYNATVLRRAPNEIRESAPGDVEHLDVADPPLVLV